MNFTDMLLKYSTNQDGIKRESEALVHEKELSKSITSCDKISERIDSLTIKTQTNEVVIFHVSPPDWGHHDIK